MKSQESPPATCQSGPTFEFTAMISMRSVGSASRAESKEIRIGERGRESAEKPFSKKTKYSCADNLCGEIVEITPSVGNAVLMVVKE